MEVLSDPEAQDSRDIDKKKTYIGLIFAGTICGCCCGSIGSFPLLRFQETTRKQKFFIVGLITAGIIGIIVSLTIGIVYYASLIDILRT